MDIEKKRRINYWGSFLRRLQSNSPINFEIDIGTSPNICYWERIIERLLKMLLGT
jgi:hypothetical protein